MTTATDKRLDSLEGELKLLKTEIKHGMTDVHDFLEKLKLPPPTNGDTDINIGNRLDLNGRLNMNHDREPARPRATSYAAENQGNDAKLPQPQTTPAPKNMKSHSAPARAPISEKNEIPDNAPKAESVPPASEIDEPEKMVIGNNGNNGNHNFSQSLPVPQVNLLANLVRWVAVAREKIGAERIPTFLDVYGTTGNLTSEIKQVILQLSGVVVEPAKNGNGWNQVFTEQLSALIEVYSLNGQIASEVKDNLLHFVKILVGQSEPEDLSDIWSRLILELHGILAGGGASLQPFGSSNGSKDKEKNKALLEKAQSHDESEEHKPASKDKHIKLKFILPSENGDDKEFFIT